MTLSLHIPPSGVCEGCGVEFPTAPSGRPRRYCGNACRQRAYRRRRGSVVSEPGAYRSGDGWALHVGHATRVLDALPAASVQTIVTSPPYFNLRDYRGHPDQLGHEATPQDYVAALVEVCHAAARVLRPDGTMWLNLGDTYSSTANAGPSSDRHAGRGHRRGVTPTRVNTTATAPLKNLLLIPSRVALALQEDGWIVRNDIIWHKTNAMPHSVGDRLGNRHEHLYLLTRQSRYYFDLDAVRIPSRTEYETRNPGDVWPLATRGSSADHFAMFPPEIPRRCIAASTRPGDVVLDPFAGRSTTGRVALESGRRYLGIDINAADHDAAAPDLNRVVLQEDLPSGN